MTLYTMHMASAFSIWCWLVLSGSRFVAVYKPIVYRVKWSGPRKALMILAAVCALLELWILYAGAYDEDSRACYDEKIFVPNTVLHLFEIFWSYVVPLVLIIVFDFLVLCRNHTTIQLISEATGKPLEAKISRGTIVNAGAIVEKTDEELMQHRIISVCRYESCKCVVDTISTTDIDEKSVFQHI